MDISSNRSNGKEKMPRSNYNDPNNGMQEEQNLDFVAVIPKSPTQFFVYWELSGQRSKQYSKKTPPDSFWCLSLLNLDEDGDVNWRSEIQIDPDAKNYYLRVQPGAHYRVELGVKTGEHFHPICHSRVHIAPRDLPKDSINLKTKWKEFADSALKPPDKKTSNKTEREIPEGLVWKEGLTDELHSS